MIPTIRPCVIQETPGQRQEGWAIIPPDTSDPIGFVVRRLHSEGDYEDYVIVSVDDVYDWEL